MAFKFSQSSYLCAMAAEQYRIQAQRDYLDAQNAYNNGFYALCSSFAMLACNSAEAAKAMQSNAENKDRAYPSLRCEIPFEDTKQVADEQLKLADEAIEGM